MNQKNIEELIQATETDQTCALRLEQKIKLTIKLLYVTILIQFASMTASVLNVMEISRVSGIELASISPSVFVFPFMIVVFSFWVIRELKFSDLAWGWVGGLSLFAMALMTWAFPVAILGLLTLLDHKVRSRYLNILDIQL